VTGDASIGLGPRGKTVDGNNDHHKQDNCDDNRKDDHGSSAHRESFPSAVPYHDPAPSNYTVLLCTFASKESRAWERFYWRPGWPGKE
jgi:hypothetical protein